MEDIRLSIDAYTLDRTAGKQRVRAIEQDGSLVFETPKPPGAEFSEEVERLWTEYPDGLLDITEESLSALPPDDDAVPKREDGAEGEKEDRDPGQIMTAEEMEALRSEVFLQLNDARNELWYVLELAKTLAVSTEYTSDPPPNPHHPLAQKKKKPVTDGPSVKLQPGVEPPILPPGTFSATAAITPLQPALNAYDLQLALAAKQEALEECSALIDGAVEELQIMSDAGDKFWHSVREPRDGRGGKGQWAIVPRPDFGRNMAEGERAKDIIIPYALDEAPPALRARSLAAFDLDPAKLESLTFGARTHHRLRVTLHDQKGVRSSSLASEPSSEDIGALMEAVQAEAFDEDLFNELRIEAIRSDYTVEPRRITTKIGEVEVSFELYDTRQPPSSDPTSPQSDLILHLANLSLLRLHRHRKTQLITQASRLAPTMIPGPPILAPILQGLRYQQMIQSVKSALAMFVDVMTGSGIPAHLESSWAASAAGGEEGDWFAAGDDRDLLSGLDGELKLNIDKMQGVTVALSPTRSFTLTTSKATFPISDPSDLPSLLAQELESQLLTYAERALNASGEAREGEVFLDDLDGVVTLPDAGLSISIPAPYSSIQALLEPFDTAVQTENYDSKETDLISWLRAIAERIR